jgi:hypothetical protein
MITSVMDMEQTTRAPFDPTRTSANKRFSKYKSEPKKVTREADVKESKTLKQMKDAWSTCGYDANQHYIHNYPSILKAVKNLQYTAEDVLQFSIILNEFQHEQRFSEKASIFLSALINGGKDSNYVIFTKYFDTPLDNLGYWNKKNITVDGNVGNKVGFGMEGGSITVKGNAGDSVGIGLRGGSIIVEGNTGKSVGFRMHDGSIIVEGNAGDGVGNQMQGGSITVKGTAGSNIGYMVVRGEIYLEGDYESLSDVVLRTDSKSLPEERGRKIYHKGKMIYPSSERSN